MSALPERVPVQGDGPWYVSPSHPARQSVRTHEPGTISREEYQCAWEAYDIKWRSGQSAERMVERGGFSFFELVDLLGHEPETFEPRKTGPQ